MGSEALNALAPFAALATEAGRAPFKLNSIDPFTTEGLTFDHSSDDALIPLLVRVGDIRAARRIVDAPEDSPSVERALGARLAMVSFVKMLRAMADRPERAGSDLAQFLNDLADDLEKAAAEELVGGNG